MAIIIKTKMIEAECVRYTTALGNIGFISQPAYVALSLVEIETEPANNGDGNQAQTKTEWRVAGHRGDSDPQNSWFDVPGFDYRGHLRVTGPGGTGFASRSKRGLYAALLQSRRTIELMVAEGFTLSAKIK